MKPSARVRGLCGLALLVSVGVVGFLALRDRQTPSDSSDRSDQATHRTNLVLQAGSWHLPGQSNGFTGLLVDTYPDGVLKSRSAVSNGFLEGLSTGWHTNGQPQIEEHFRASLSEGLRVKWFPDGRKLSEANIVAGKLEGTFRRWHDNGQLAEQMEMKSGEPDGVAFAYYPSGFVKARTRVENGKVLDQKVWPDGEQREPLPAEAPDESSLPAGTPLAQQPKGGG